MANIAIMALGTLGDINPFLCIAKDLKARGHKITFISNAYYQQQISSTNVDFKPLGETERVATTLSNPDLWDKKKSSKLFYQLCIDLTEPGYNTIADLDQKNGIDVIIAPVYCFSAKLANEKFNIPLITVMPNPILVRSIHAPAVYPVLPWLSNCGSLGARLLYSLLDKSFEKFLNEPINQIREKLALPHLDKVKPWLKSSNELIGLWPAWFKPPQIDWPDNITLTGFLHYDGETTSNSALPDSINQKPIVVAPGSAMMHAKDLFRTIVDASVLLDKPVLLMTPYTEQLPSPLPDHVRHIHFYPFQQLLHKCSAIIHHGGIGTTARSFSAGIPQFITPMAFDQFDNANLIKKAGVGDYLYQDKINAKSLAKKLHYLLSSKMVKNNCKRISKNMEENNNDNTLEKIHYIIESITDKIE